MARRSKASKRARAPRASRQKKLPMTPELRDALRRAANSAAVIMAKIDEHEALRDYPLRSLVELDDELSAEESAGKPQFRRAETALNQLIADGLVLKNHTRAKLRGLIGKKLEPEGRRGVRVPSRNTMDRVLKNRGVL
jgi:hypothetical protein